MLLQYMPDRRILFLVVLFGRCRQQRVCGKHLIAETLCCAVPYTLVYIGWILPRFETHLFPSNAVWRASGCVARDEEELIALIFMIFQPLRRLSLFSLTAKQFEAFMLLPLHLQKFVVVKSAYLTQAVDRGHPVHAEAFSVGLDNVLPIILQHPLPGFG